MSKTLELRAAEYFGLQGEPRVSVNLGNGRVAIVAERRGRKVLAFYEENHWRTIGQDKLLTERQRTVLADALSD
jgi:hypothetical protein